MDAVPEREALARLLEVQRNAIVEATANLENYEKLEGNYRQLDERLTELPKKLSHEVTVPINGVGFFLGKLVHTNEITVLLSSEYLVQVSASTAKDIVRHRIDTCRKRQEKSREEIQHLQQWLKHSMSEEGDGTESRCDIREEYNQESMDEWRVAHAQRLKEHKRKERLEKEETDASESIWERLEELEIEEEMERYKSGMTSNRSVQPSSSEMPSSATATPTPDKLRGILKKSPSLDNSQKSVSFPEEQEEEEDSLDSDDYDDEDEQPVQPADAFTGLVVERNPTVVKSDADREPETRVSRFKASRR